MNKLSSIIRQSVNWGGRSKQVTRLVASAALLLSLVVPLAAPLAQSAARVQPQLLNMAAQQPDQMVSVIVQKAVNDDRAEQAVSALGGTVTTDLHIINAFAAEMSAQAAVQLSRIESVGWVSLDAPVISTRPIRRPPMTEIFSFGAVEAFGPDLLRVRAMCDVLFSINDGLPCMTCHAGEDVKTEIFLSDQAARRTSRSDVTNFEIGRMAFVELSPTISLTSRNWRTERRNSSLIACCCTFTASANVGAWIVSRRASKLHTTLSWA